MADILAEQITIRLNEKEKALLDAYQATRPALARSGCFIQMLHEVTWQAEENSKTSRLDRIERTQIEHGALLRLLCDKLSVDVD